MLEYYIKGVNKINVVSKLHQLEGLGIRFDNTFPMQFN